MSGPSYLGNPLPPPRRRETGMPDDSELLPGRTLSTVETRPDEQQVVLREAAEAVVEAFTHAYSDDRRYHLIKALRAALAVSQAPADDDEQDHYEGCPRCEHCACAGVTR